MMDMNVNRDGFSSLKFKALFCFKASSNVIIKVSAFLSILLNISGCTYLKYVAVQDEYAKLHEAQPGQINLKHMLDRDTFFIYGQYTDPKERFSNIPMAIAAYSNAFKENEQVDVMYLSGSNLHYGLNVPEGEYEVLVFADSNNNQRFENTEVIGQHHLHLDKKQYPAKVMGNVDISLQSERTVPSIKSFPVPKQFTQPLTTSALYPHGSIRQLDDPIFDKSFSTLGMYDPAAFLEQAPILFYALEEDAAQKIPVIFVHGISGSAREFEPIVNKLNRKRYKPWFYHYPSGGDLDQMAEMFYQIFLSGKIVPHQEMPLIIVAHSMGGLVVREALNKYKDSDTENKTHLIMTLATPFGGHKAAEAGEKRGLIVLPSWRDLNPKNTFINNLFRNPIPEFAQHEILYAFKNSKRLLKGENSDGVVSLASQLHAPAQQQAHSQFGFNTTHTGILQEPETIDHIIKNIESVKQTYYPKEHMDWMDLGGFDVDLSEGYGKKSQLTIRQYGHYAMALIKGIIKPVHPLQQQFIDAAQGKIKPKTPLEKDWQKLMKQYPELINNKMYSSRTI